MQSKNSEHTSEKNSDRTADRPAAGAVPKPNMATEQKSAESKQKDSIGSMIARSLAEESQEGVDRLFSEIKDSFEATKEYIAENPREAAGLAVFAGFAAWALFATKPGRLALEAGSVVAVPYMTKWVARNFSGVTH